MIKIEQNVPLKQISHYKIGGKAKYFFEAKNIDGLIKAVEKQRQLKMPLFILAGATNVLIDDKGFDGLIIKIQSADLRTKFDIIKAESGIPMAELVKIAAEKNLSGLEWAAGLPGTLGGAIRGNAGAFGKETKNIIQEVISLNISQKNPKIVKRKAKDCNFEYRSSIFKKQSFNKFKTKEIIIEATLKFQKGDKKEIEERMTQNINYRLSKHPMEYPSLGSIFKNIPLSQIKKTSILKSLPVKNDPFPIIPTAFLISEAGLRGIACGGAMISPKHPNFIVNVMNATSDDVKNLIQLAKNEIRKKFGIELHEEIEYLT